MKTWKFRKLEIFFTSQKLAECKLKVLNNLHKVHGDCLVSATCSTILSGGNISTETYANANEPFKPEMMQIRSAMNSPKFYDFTCYKNDLKFWMLDVLFEWPLAVHWEIANCKLTRSFCLWTALLCSQNNANKLKHVMWLNWYILVYYTKCACFKGSHTPQTKCK